MFEKKERPLNYLFSLSGLSQINFDVYDDQKSNMTGLIDNRDFAEMVKKAYMRAVFQKLRDLFKKRPTSRLFKISQGKMEERMVKECLGYLDKEWLDYLPGLDLNRTFTMEVIKPAKSSAGFKAGN